MKNLSKYAVIGLLAMLLGLTACGNSKKETVDNRQANPEMEKVHSEGEAKEVMLTAKQFDALQMEIDTPKMRNMSGYVETNGQLEVPPQNEATVTTVVGANVVSIEVIEGDKVNKGQTVAYLSHPNIIEKQTDYLDAYSNSQFLKKEYERQKTLYDAGVGSGANFQKAEGEYLVSRSKANGLEAQLQQLGINSAGVRNGTIYQRVPLKSPIEGFVEKVKVKTGQYVEPQTDLMEIVDTHHVHADLMVFEKDVYKVKEGQKVIFNVQSIPGKELTAEIYSVGKTFEQNPKAIHVHAEIENKEGQLIPGMYIQGRIQTENTQTVAIPEAAIAADGERFFVFSAEKEGEDWSFKPIEVAKSTKDGDWIAIDFLTEQQPNTKYAYDNAYYLMAEMKKGESEEHGH
ncbi:efflux RND transporter periplasmic adaptor subunit [Flagellimonas zhangzhouensis]|uniref:Membrane fusion protein, cobalt-zinc-cadmium efflux system n=1 Tax=Flagellimonas zhangzhouensis TaxID=1073328 RepID=A0A1H2XSF7_9FLAO|nr:efflux RND transporter periplasmic adaptor subunit [Allomuricauda zhangzhouensis]SDQ90831.1 membrane fusion protein, cobalt-zinc-cadmium efflux system [Allomuricauda zhangzhouensis]SDW95608.1 membrane fusion protein, cobalt-zinc-cadmium efflux system [Allomuricauda zhangzhouensis]